MKGVLKNNIAIFVSALLVLTICIIYVVNVPESSSWLHQEEKINGDYKIGKIDFWLNGVENHSIPVDFSMTAPTRFFHQTDRDENFDMAVKLYEVTGSNQGDIDVGVDFSCTDSNTGSSIFYIFVPRDETNENFTEGQYRDYLDSVLNAYPLSNQGECKAAMNAVNQAFFTNNKSILSQKGTNSTLCYILVWAEYDNIDYGTPGQYVNITYPIKLNAYAHQLYLMNP